tara:strand:+ start:476 stop:1333 length:858 start_codon:yes stop_codon:yes gene_type:complete
MASKIKVDQIEGAGGTTITVPSGQTLDASSATVTLPNGAVSAAKLNADIISGQTELTSSPADTDEFLISDAGVLKRIDASLIGGGGYQSMQVFTSSGTYTKPSGIKKIKVYITGGGASGAGAANNSDFGGGGGAGGTAIETLDATSINTVTVTIDGGGGTVTGDNHGNAGGTSSFGSHLSATGGSTGRHGNAGHVRGGVGGLGSGGDINLYGGAGHGGDDSDNNHMTGGNGGQSFWGGAGMGVGSNETGSATDRAGKHGSGGGGSGNGVASGSGGAGICVVEEYK